MNIAFFSPGGSLGKLPRTFSNARTDAAWMIALDAEHVGLDSQNHHNRDNYDLGLVIMRKGQVADLSYISNLCDKVGIIQEGPAWLFQDYPAEQQYLYLQMMNSVDYFFCHNEHDQKYFRGIIDNPRKVKVIRSLMITDNIREIEDTRSGVIVGGNFVSWYGGFDSTQVAKIFGEHVMLPSMGRRIQGEEIFGLEHIPFIDWTSWIHKVAHFKYGVHLMRTFAAGTFAMNLAYWGIPCIGYNAVDTQRLCHPAMSVDLDDIEKAKEIAMRLRDDEVFYKEASTLSKNNFKKYYSEENWKKHFWEQLNG